jgi:hypothetical protein
LKAAGGRWGTHSTVAVVSVRDWRLLGAIGYRQSLEAAESGEAHTAQLQWYQAKIGGC